ncbi:predicted protein [Plenodomus lingam JN3]|uniref:Predicted protein n=1 Tax=Leptosphaeria maculans (strain JN3 / isolate v23.1.3 / race Av1-4-5-6-7-8) TaxID=985895 RepID=E4ZLZ2_LEPMJ|nr:predicted protein [Plenodomus lingam JN3]CBX92822.1 predicted protein [Plenodomus lingam JN3]
MKENQEMKCVEADRGNHLYQVSMRELSLLQDFRRL